MEAVVTEVVFEVLEEVPGTLAKAINGSVQFEDKFFTVWALSFMSTRLLHIDFFSWIQRCVHKSCCDICLC
jgi:hypothetical protein